MIIKWKNIEQNFHEPEKYKFIFSDVYIGNRTHLGIRDYLPKQEEICTHIVTKATEKEKRLYYILKKLKKL